MDVHKKLKNQYTASPTLYLIIICCLDEDAWNQDLAIAFIKQCWLWRRHRDRRRHHLLNQPSLRLHLQSSSMCCISKRTSISEFQIRESRKLVREWSQLFFRMNKLKVAVFVTALTNLAYFKINIAIFSHVHINREKRKNIFKITHFNTITS